MWGPAPNQWPDDVAIGALALRRELVVVDGAILEQHLDPADLTPGSLAVADTR